MNTVTTTLGKEAEVTWTTEDEVTADERRVLNRLFQGGPLWLNDVPDDSVNTLVRRDMVLVFQGRVHLTERGADVLTACQRKRRK